MLGVYSTLVKFGFHRIYFGFLCAYVLHSFANAVTQAACNLVRDEPKLLGDSGEALIFLLQWLTI
jgi:hypothetical protein